MVLFAKVLAERGQSDGHSTICWGEGGWPSSLRFYPYIKLLAIKNVFKSKKYKLYFGLGVSRIFFRKKFDLDIVCL